MAQMRVLIFGIEAALKTPRARDLLSQLKQVKAQSFVTHKPEDLKGELQGFDWAILICDANPPPAMTVWQAYFSKMRKRPKFAALVERALPSGIQTELMPDPVVSAGQSLGALIQRVSTLGGAASESLENAKAPAPKLPETLTNRQPTVSRTQVGTNALEDLILSMGAPTADIKAAAPQPALDEPVSAVGDVNDLSNDLGFDSISEPSQEVAPSDAAAPAVSVEPFETPVVETDAVDLGLELSKISEVETAMESATVAQSAPSSRAPVVEEEDRTRLVVSATPSSPQAGAAFVEGPPDIGDLSVATAFASMDQLEDLKKNLPKGGVGISVRPTSKPSFEADDKATKVAIPTPRLPAKRPPRPNGTLSGVVLAAPPVLDLNESQEAVAKLSAVPDSGPERFEANERTLPSLTIEANAMSSGPENETIKRYAALKERESREREAMIEALNKQLVQVKDRLERSEAERRRLTLEMDEVRASIGSLEDARDQNLHHVKKLESSHQEALRSVQLRLDNAQFQANRAEKKLEEFRERVRNDILRIRLRERELANKLELQKRDAEALLVAKDERLLAQKREIDRLEFEIESMKERMIEETQRAEERSGKLSRALQSLKMAQGVLSGIEEEVIPSQARNPSGEGNGEAA